MVEIEEKKEIDGRRKWAEEVRKKYENEIKELEKSIEVKKKRIEELECITKQTIKKLQKAKTCKEVTKIKRELNKTRPIFYMHAETKKAELEQEKEKIIKELNDITREYIDEIKSNTEKIKKIQSDMQKEINNILYDEKELIKVVDYESVSDNIEPRLRKNYVEVYGDYVGDGGFSNRFAKRWFEIIDEDVLNNKPAYLFEVGVATYYRREFRGVKKKRYLVGWDDGEVFLTQVYTTANSVKEAIDRLIPKAVKDAQSKGKRVVRWGDIWFVECEKTTQKETEKITIRENHVVEGWRENGKIYAVRAVSHDHHPCPSLEGKVWEVARNKTVSRTIAYD